MPFRIIVVHATKTLTALLLVMVCATSMAQELYKWTDEQGNVHYGDKPPAGRSAEAGASDVQSIPRPTTNKRIPLHVETESFGDIVRYVFESNEVWSSHSYIPSRIVISDDILWIPFRESVLAFEPQSRQLSKFTLDRSERGLAAQYMHLAGDKYIFPQTNENHRYSVFSIYDYENDVQSELPIATKSTQIVTYDDNHEDGVFGYSYLSKSLLQYPDVSADASEGEVAAHERVIATDIAGVTALSATKDTIWHAYGYRQPCVAHFYDKKTQATRTFTSDDIGGRSANGCIAIVADENEVWLSAPDEKDRRIKNTTFSVYDVRTGQWETIPKPEVNPGPVAMSLQMDEHRVYYINCQRIVAVNRSTKRVTDFSFNEIGLNQEYTSCINVLRVSNGVMWALKYERGNFRKRYPVLYAMPTEKMVP